MYVFNSLLRCGALRCCEAKCGEAEIGVGGECVPCANATSEVGCATFFSDPARTACSCLACAGNYTYERQLLDGSLRCVDSPVVSYSCGMLGPNSWTEITSSTAPGKCGTTVFRCGSVDADGNAAGWYGNCVPPSARCDGRNDCGDSADEADCPATCATTNGTCDISCDLCLVNSMEQVRTDF